MRFDLALLELLLMRSVILSFLLIIPKLWADCAWPTDLRTIPHEHFVELGLEAKEGIAEFFANSDLPLNFSNSEFRSYVLSKINPDPWEILKKQEAIFGKHFPNFVKRFEMVIQGELGKIEPIHCIEALLLERHWEKQGPLKISEYGASIFGKGNQINILFRSEDEPTVPQLEEELALYGKLKSDGWSFLMHIHNHPFFFENSTGDVAGTTIPSGDAGKDEDGGFGDVGTFIRWNANFGLEGFRITNGFSTITGNVRDISLLKTWN